MAEHACVIVTDDYPCFFLPRMVASAARRLSVRWRKSTRTVSCPWQRRPRFSRPRFRFAASFRSTSEPISTLQPQAYPLSRLELPPIKSIPAEILPPLAACAGELARRDFERTGTTPDRPFGWCCRLPRRIDGRKESFEALPQALAR